MGVAYCIHIFCFNWRGLEWKRPVVTVNFRWKLSDIVLFQTCLSIFWEFPCFWEVWNWVFKQKRSFSRFWASGFCKYETVFCGFVQKSLLCIIRPYFFAGLRDGEHVRQHCGFHHSAADQHHDGVGPYRRGGVAPPILDLQRPPARLTPHFHRSHTQASFFGHSLFRNFYNFATRFDVFRLANR